MLCYVETITYNNIWLSWQRHYWSLHEELGALVTNSIKLLSPYIETVNANFGQILRIWRRQPPLVQFHLEKHQLEWKSPQYRKKLVNKMWMRFWFTCLPILSFVIIWCVSYLYYKFIGWRKATALHHGRITLILFLPSSCRHRIFQAHSLYILCLGFTWDPHITRQLSQNLRTGMYNIHKNYNV